MSDITVKHEPENSRYAGYIDGTEAGFADYREADGVRDFFHTVTHEEFGGKGVAGAVVTYALDDSISNGFTFKPTCSYVSHFVEKHPEYADKAV